jgi:hypothetical protein
MEPVTAAKAIRRRLKVDMELPMKEAYEAFIRDRLREPFHED